MTKLDAGLITPLPASDSGSAAAGGSKRINPRPQFCLCLTWSGCPLNDDDEPLTNYQKLLFQVLYTKVKKNCSGKTALQAKPSNNRFNKLSSVYRNF